MNLLDTVLGVLADDTTRDAAETAASAAQACRAAAQTVLALVRGALLVLTWRHQAEAEAGDATRPAPPAAGGGPRDGGPGAPASSARAATRQPRRLRPRGERDGARASGAPRRRRRASA